MRCLVVSLVLLSPALVQAEYSPASSHEQRGKTPLLQSGPSSWIHSTSIRLSQHTETKAQDSQNKWVMRPQASELEWSLLWLEGFSGAIVAAVSSLLFQTWADIAIVNNTPTAENVEVAGWASTIGTFGVVPWLVGLTVYLLGKLSHVYVGNYWWALAGAYVGGAVSFGLGRLISFLDTTVRKDIATPIRFILDGVLMAFGAVLLHTLFLKKSGDFIQLGALLQWDGHHVRLGVPVPQFTQPTQKDVAVTLPLFSGTF